MARKKKIADLTFASGRVLVGSCLDRLKDLPDASIDSIVTDPPYELGFMGKSWDASGIAYNVELWTECLRVLKPGGHLLAFGGTRTYHRMVVAIEDAGFEIRDSIHWIYGSGFPKSLDVSKAIDKQAGAERPVIGKAKHSQPAKSGHHAGSTAKHIKPVEEGRFTPDVTAPATDAAKQWAGWGTALKPAHEPIVVARKPLAGTVAANVLAHGTGALNIDECRIGEFVNTTPSGIDRYNQNYVNDGAERATIEGTTSGATGRWPANVIFDKAAGVELDAQSGIEASRFFYCAKPGKKERNAGLEGLPESTSKFGNQKNGEDNGDGSVNDKFTTAPKQNFHPTVKPVALMRYLVRLVTPPNGTVLDPFLGSGTTAVAAIREGFDWVGCEMTADYLPIIKGRVTHAVTEAAKEQPTLFEDAA